MPIKFKAQVVLFYHDDYDGDSKSGKYDRCISGRECWIIKFAEAVTPNFPDRGSVQIPSIIVDIFIREKNMVEHREPGRKHKKRGI